MIFLLIHSKAEVVSKLTLEITTLGCFKQGFEMPTEAEQNFSNLGLNWF